jgi:hypothetical protein
MVPVQQVLEVKVVAGWFHLSFTGVYTCKYIQRCIRGEIIVMRYQGKRIKLG